MIIGYIREMESVIKAAIALRKNPGSTLVYGRDIKDLGRKLSTYHGEPYIMADEDVKNIPFNIKSYLWVQMPACGMSQKGLSVGSYMTYSLRNRKCVPNELVILAATYYPELKGMLAQKDSLSKKYFHLYRETMGELCRMKGLTRFTDTGKVLYVEVFPEHLIIDLFLEWASSRFSSMPSLIKSHRDHYLVNANYLGYNKHIVEVSPEEAEKLKSHISFKDDKLWDIFYRSQYVESRRNKEYALRKIPEKCSYINPEIRKQRKMLERGIPDTTLDDF